MAQKTRKTAAKADKAPKVYEYRVLPGDQRPEVREAALSRYKENGFKVCKVDDLPRAMKPKRPNSRDMAMRREVS